MKKLHKAALATVLATMMVSGANPVLAATEGKTEPNPVEQTKPVLPAGTISEQQAIAKVKQLFAKELKGLTEIRADYGPKFPTDVMVWHVSASETKEVAYDNPQTTLYVDIDAKTGQVRGYQYQNIEWTGKKMPAMEQAFKIADEYLKTNRPDLYAKVKRTNFSGGGGGGSSAAGKDGKEISWMHRTIQYTEMVGGVPFLANVVEVNIDEFGNVVGMKDRLDFDATKLPPRSMAVPVSKAQKVLQEQVQMKKQYTTTVYKPAADGDYTLEDRLVLGYHPTGTVEAIDAITGKPLEEFYRSPFTEKEEAIKLTGTNGQWIAKDKEDAKRLVADLLKVDLSKMYFQEEKDMGPADSDIWFFTWRNHHDQQFGQPFNITASFDAKTGYLMSANRQDMVDSKQERKATLSIDQARDKALELLKSQLGAGEHELFLTRESDRTKSTRVFPKWFDQTKNDYASWTRPDNRYSFHFAKGYQGVPIGDQGYSVDYDAVTGQLLSVHIARTKAELTQLPDNKNTIGEADAEQKFLENTPLSLAYIWPQVMDQYAPEGQLVYRLDSEKSRIDYIDALSGELVKFPEHP